MVLPPVHPSGTPQGAEELTACFSNPRELLVPGAEVAQAGHSGSPAALPGHTCREAVLEPAPILLLWGNFGEMGGQRPSGWHCCSNTRRGAP